jgi:amidase
MTVQLPSPQQLCDVAKQCGLSLSDGDLASFRGLMAGSIGAYNLVECDAGRVPEVKYLRTPSHHPVAGRDSAQRLVPARRRHKGQYDGWRECR